MFLELAIARAAATIVAVAPTPELKSQLSVSERLTTLISLSGYDGLIVPPGMRNMLRQGPAHRGRRVLVAFRPDYLHPPPSGR
jgi:hypothetical protein